MPISKFGQSIADYMENAIQKTFPTVTNPKQGTITMFVKVATLPPLSIQVSTSLSIEQLLAQILGSEGQPYRKEIANINLLSSANNVVKTVANYQATITDYALTNESTIQLVLANEGLLGGFGDWASLISTTTAISTVQKLAVFVYSCCTGKKNKSYQPKKIHYKQTTYELHLDTSITVADLMAYFNIKQADTTEGFWSTNQGEKFYKWGVDSFSYNDIQDGLIVEELNVARVYNIQLNSNDDGRAILTTDIVTNIEVQLTTTFASNAANVGAISGGNILTLTGKGEATITCSVQLLKKELRNQPAQVVCNIHRAILKFTQGQYKAEYLRLIPDHTGKPIKLPNFLISQVSDTGREVLILLQKNDIIAATLTEDSRDFTLLQDRSGFSEIEPNGNDETLNIDLANDNIVFAEAAYKHRHELLYDYHDLNATYHDNAKQIIDNELGGGTTGGVFVANPSKTNYRNLIIAFIRNYAGGANNDNIKMSFYIESLDRFYKLKFPANNNTSYKASILFNYNASTLTVYHVLHA